MLSLWLLLLLTVARFAIIGYLCCSHFCSASCCLVLLLLLLAVRLCLSFLLPILRLRLHLSEQRACHPAKRSSMLAVPAPRAPAGDLQSNVQISPVFIRHTNLQWVIINRYYEYHSYSLSCPHTSMHHLQILNFWLQLQLFSGQVPATVPAKEPCSCLASTPARFCCVSLCITSLIRWQVNEFDKHDSRPWKHLPQCTPRSHQSQRSSIQVPHGPLAVPLLVIEDHPT